MQKFRFLIPAGVALGIVFLVFSITNRPFQHAESANAPPAPDDFRETVLQLEGLLEAKWNEAGITPTTRPVDELLILRRLSLVLHGTIPSLEEVRQFQNDTEPDRLTRWTVRMLDDPRFADYMAERLARAFVGAEGGAFIIFRRDRFTDWLSEQLQNNTPYNEIVRAMIAEEGLWTGQPATNFITSAVANDELDRNKLAARSVRAFLGQRIDCAQCHDHPWDAWKQTDFEGLAAWYGQVQFTVAGVEDVSFKDGEPVEFHVEDRMTLEKRQVDPRVPFGDEWLPEEGSRRQRFAAWVTHPENLRFERAIANRMWALLLGQPFSPDKAVDDLSDPDPDDLDVIDLLGQDFREHNYDLRRLILVITSSQPFRLASRHDLTDENDFRKLKSNWGVFTINRLRPEQLIGSMLQAASIKTIDRNSHLLVRIVRLLRENDFVKEYGDLGDDEFSQRSGTITQALQRMNGKLTKETTEATFLNASGRIEALSCTPELRLENCFLACLTRLPTETEKAELLPLMAEPDEKIRRQNIEDLFWALFNSPEFSWNL